MVVDDVTAGRGHLLRLIGGQGGGIKLGGGPHGERLIGKPPGAVLNRGFVPRVELAEPCVELKWTLFEAARHVALLAEGAIAVLSVVAGECEVAEGVQPLVLHALPLGTERLPPPLRQIGVLRQNVFDGVLVHRHTLLAAVVLQSAQPVAAAAKIIEVAGVQIAAELIVAGEAPIRGQYEEVRLDAFEIAILLQPLTEGGEGLVHRVGGDGADGAAEHVGLHQPHRGGEVGGAEPVVGVVVVQLEQKRVSDLDLQLAQVVEGHAERRVLLAAQREGAEVAGEGADLLHQRLDARVAHGRGAGVIPERLVDLAFTRDVTRAHGEVVAHEAVELAAVGLLPEVQLHRPPVLLVEARLEPGLEAHEDEVADQVSLAQLLAGGVHALEDELRVVLVAAERDVHDHQLGEAATDRGEVALLLGEQLSEQVEVLRHAQRRLFGLLRVLDDGLERRVVGL